MTTPFFSVQDLSSVQAGNVEAAQSLTNVMLEAGHKITLLNLEMTRNALSQGAASFSSNGADGSSGALPGQPLAKETATYFKNLAHISAETQVEIARLVQSHMSEFGKTAISLLDRASSSDNNVGAAMAVVALKSAVATATASCQNLTETTRRVTEMAQANANALADTVQSIGTHQAHAARSYQKAA
ncbi:MAG: hypothetical protein H6R10_1593 [Rhodocyclaceae bacterium]|nr:hypothetical protein [Rhodocyclaceae bacterium]